MYGHSLEIMQIHFGIDWNEWEKLSYVMQIRLKCVRKFSCDFKKCYVLDDVKVMCIRNKYSMIHKVEPVAKITIISKMHLTSLNKIVSKMWEKSFPHHM